MATKYRIWFLCYSAHPTNTSRRPISSSISFKFHINNNLDVEPRRLEFVYMISKIPNSRLILEFRRVPKTDWKDVYDALYSDT